MKTLTLETCKRLAEAGIEIETEKIWLIHSEGADLEDWIHKDITDFPAPNLEEAIELLPHYIVYFDPNIGQVKGKFTHRKDDSGHGIWYESSNVSAFKMEMGKTLIGAVEKMIVYLLDNELLGKK